MSAGYIQLAAIGQQDAYLTGEPQVTYFSGVYKRHTPFVLEAYDIPFNDQLITYGGTSICRIPPKGDLIRSLTLKVDLPALENPGNDFTWPTQPSSINFPRLWFGLADGSTVGPISAGTGFQYYSTNSASLIAWFSKSTLFGPYATYSTSLSKFIFSNSSVGLSNVIVSATAPPTSALSGVFWGFDPVNYSSATSSNLIYNAVSGVVTPDFTLLEAGWFQTAGLPIDPYTGLYFNLNQTISFSGLSFMNFSGTTALGSYWTSNGLLSITYKLSAGGGIQFLSPGYYTIRAGFNVDAGASIQSMAYATSTTATAPLTPSFSYVVDCVVSPDPSTPLVIPFIVTDATLYYYFYATTNGSQILPGTYFTVSRANDIYQFSSNIALSGTSLATLPFYGNTNPSNSTIALNPDSTLNFTVNGEYLITGTLSLNDPSYVSNVVVGEGSNVVYDYDLSLQGRNPTYAFSIPVVADNTRNYYIKVSTTGSLSNILSNSFLAVNQIGVLADTAPSFILPYNGVLLQTTSNLLTTPLQLKSPYFSSNTNPTAMINVNSSGNLTFSNAISYMMTGVFYTSNAVTNVSVASSDSTFTPQVYPLALGLAPPYTVSIPFVVANTAATYSISLGINGATANVLDRTYVSVVPLASNLYSPTTTTIFNYYDSVGTYIIANADLKIGGQTIQSITGEYIEIWNELNVPYENQPGLQLMTGKYDTGTSVAPPGRTYYVNLPYYFYGNPELSIPITALGRQDIEIWVTFRNFSELTDIVVANPTLTATIITEYVYLANPEIDWFQNHRLDYVITQTQYQEFDLIQGFKTAVFELNFKGPVKELFFVIQPDGNLPYDYSNNGLQSMGMTFNGEDAFLTSCTDATYLGAIEPFKHHINFFSSPPGSTVPGRQFFMYCFSTNPYATTSSGQINFSRIRDVFATLNISATFSPPKQFRVVAMSQNVLRVENGIAGLMFD